MTDEITSIISTAAGRRWALIFGAVTCLLSAVLIGLLVMYGQPSNSLHTSALAWAFTMIGVVLTGLGFGAAIQAMADLKKS